MHVVRLWQWLLTLVCMVFVLHTGWGQITERTPLVIRHADEMVGFETDAGAVRELHGNVVMTHGDVEIRCDRARQELATGRAELIGNVVIVQGALRMTMLRGEYLSAQRLARGVGNVTIRDSIATLEAPQGEYLLDRRRAVFHGGVQLRDSSTTIVADSMAYNRTTGERWAWGGVRLDATWQHATVRSDSAYQYPATRVAVFSGRTLLVEWDSTASDTLFLRAERLRLRDDSLSRRVSRAEGNVRLVRGAIRARSDSAELVGEETIVLVGNPIVWADSAQLTGETIRAELVRRRLRIVRADGNAALGIVEDSVASAPHQLMAHSIVLEFDSDSLRTVRGSGQVYTLYQNRTDDGKPDGITRVASDSIVIAFGSGRIQRCTWLGGVESEYVPEHRTTPAERYLRGFVWRTETKPSRDELLHASAESKTH